MPAFQCKECLTQIVIKGNKNYCPWCHVFRSEAKIEEMPEIVDCDEEDEDSCDSEIDCDDYFEAN